jgi:hypothetical protein
VWRDVEFEIEQRKLTKHHKPNKTSLPTTPKSHQETTMHLHSVQRASSKGA